MFPSLCIYPPRLPFLRRIILISLSVSFLFPLPPSPFLRPHSGALAEMAARSLIFGTFFPTYDPHPVHRAMVPRIARGPPYLSASSFPLFSVKSMSWRSRARGAGLPDPSLSYASPSPLRFLLRQLPVIFLRSGSAKELSPKAALLLFGSFCAQ